jgi:phage-related protein
VRDFIRSLPEQHAGALFAAMKEVARVGLSGARHVRGDIYEVRVESQRQAFRVLFARETSFILLSLSAFQKKTAKTPGREIDIAESRLADWRARGAIRG